MGAMLYEYRHNLFGRTHRLIGPVVNSVYLEDIIFFADAEYDPYFARSHPQKAFPVTLKPFDIKFFKG